MFSASHNQENMLFINMLFFSPLLLNVLLLDFLKSFSVTLKKNLHINVECASDTFNFSFF